MRSMVRKARRFIYKAGRNLILGLFGIIALYLLYLAAFSTAYTNRFEHTYLVGDSPILNFDIAGILAALGLYAVKKWGKVRKWIARVNSDAAYSRKLRRICLLAIGAAGFLYVLIAQAGPVADQRYVAQLADHWQDNFYPEMGPAKYVDRYPNNIGLLMVHFFGSMVFGSLNYTAFQLGNVLALVLFCSTSARISDFMGRSRFTGLMVMIACGMFVPAYLYLTFVYGTLLGLASAATAFLYLLYFSRDHRWKHAAISLLLLFLAIVLKSNYMIFGVGMILHILLGLMRRRDWKMVPVLAGMVCILMGTQSVLNAGLYMLSGVEEGKGISPFAYVGMGLRENEERYDGWYDGYIVDTFKEAEGDTERQKAIVTEDLKERFREFWKDPAYALDFFAGKNASQWNNPDFQGWNINQAMTHDVRYPYYFYWLRTPDGVRKTDMILNLYQFLILAGVILCMLFSDKSSDVPLFAAMVLVGGFIFHTFWEAKAQYTLPYFMMLIPLAVDGNMAFVRRLAAPGGIMDPDRKMYRIRLGMLLAVLVFAGVIGLGRIRILNTLFIRNEDSRELETYIWDSTPVHVRTGNYSLAARKGGPSDGMLFFKVHILATRTDDTFIIQLKDKKVLTVENGTAEEGTKVAGDYLVHADSQLWEAHESAKPGEINILYQKDWALTYDPETGDMYLSEYTDSENQRWFLGNR